LPIPFLLAWPGAMIGGSTSRCAAVAVTAVVTRSRSALMLTRRITVETTLFA